MSHILKYCENLWIGLREIISKTRCMTHQNAHHFSQASSAISATNYQSYASSIHCKSNVSWSIIVHVTWQVEQKPGGRLRGREWATLGVHPLSWLLSNNRLEKVPFVSVPHTSSNRLLLSNQDKGCTSSVAHSLALPLGPALLNLWTIHARTSKCVRI